MAPSPVSHARFRHHARRAFVSFAAAGFSALAGGGAAAAASASTSAVERETLSPTPRVSPGAESDRVRVSLRPSLGLGGSTLGGAGRLGVGAQYWISPALGLGVEGALFGHQDGGALVNIGGQSSTTVLALAPVLALRSELGPGVALAGVGAGFGTVSERESSLLCFDSPCEHAHDYAAYTFHAALGWLAHTHTESLELGPVLRFDAVRAAQGSTPARYFVTLNAELAFDVR